MDSMNFLNKKYTSIHNTVSLTNSHSRSNRTFIPSFYSNISQNHHHQSQKQLTGNLTQPIITNISSANAQLSANHCTIHSSQLIRHLCLDCIQLLCSQCISDHIAIHRDSNSFPNIHSLKQLRSDMNIKLSQITTYMLQQKNHPKHMMITIDALRKQSLDKIDNLRKQMIEIVQQWILRLKAAVLNNVGYQEIKLLQQEMYALHQQVNQLVNSLSSNNVSVHDIKRAYQIDADRLQKSYKQMVEKYMGLSDTMKVDIQLDKPKFMQCLEQAVALKIGGRNKNQIIKIDEEQSQIIQNNQQINQHISHVSAFKKIVHQIPNYHAPFLYNLPSGTDSLKIIDPTSKNLAIQPYPLEGLNSYPLNSVCLLNDGMVIISGGMIAQNKKSDLVQVYDYEQGKIVSQVKMSKGRSSHRMVADGDRIFIIGGFNVDNEDCRDVEILTVDGIKMAQHQCKWGGPNLSIRTNNQLLKITVSGVQSMNMMTLKWQQLTTEVPFALSKGMQISSYIDQKSNQIVVIFGDGQYYYQWNALQRKFQKVQTNLTKSVINATCVNNTVYGWVQDSKISLAKLNGQQWVIFGAK